MHALLPHTGLIYGRCVLGASSIVIAEGPKYVQKEMKSMVNVNVKSVNDVAECKYPGVVCSGILSVSNMHSVNPSQSKILQ